MGSFSDNPYYLTFRNEKKSPLNNKEMDYNFRYFEYNQIHQVISGSLIASGSTEISGSLMVSGSTLLYYDKKTDPDVPWGDNPFNGHMESGWGVALQFSDTRIGFGRHVDSPYPLYFRGWNGDDPENIVIQPFLPTITSAADDGNVGIGVLTPKAKLHAESHFEGTLSTTLGQPANAIIGSSAGGELAIGLDDTGDTIGMCIQSRGSYNLILNPISEQVHIGPTGGSGTENVLQMGGNIEFPVSNTSKDDFTIGRDSNKLVIVGGSDGIILQDEKGGDELTFTQGVLFYDNLSTSTGTDLIIESGGEIYRKSSSTLKIKKNISPFTMSSNLKNRVLELQVKNYQHRCNDTWDVGLIAEETHELVPELTIYGIDYVYDEKGQISRISGSFVTSSNDIVPENVKREQLPFYLLEIIKGQQTTIDNLTTRIEALEAGS